jgi:hypothetical protein
VLIAASASWPIGRVCTRQPLVLSEIIQGPAHTRAGGDLATPRGGRKEPAAGCPSPCAALRLTTRVRHAMSAERIAHTPRHLRRSELCASRT